MRSSWKLGGALLAAAVVAGMLPGVSAGAAPAPVAAGAPSKAAARSVTLITGDRVTVFGSDTAKASIQRGAGRTGVTFVTQRLNGSLLVIPSDAVPLLRAGKLDRRLFDVTTLLKFGYDDRRKDVPLIVTYPDGAQTKAGDTWTKARVTRALPSARGQAMKVNKKDASTFWRGLTAGGAAPKTLTAGASKLWLDGVRQPSLDESVPQIGAPDAWQAGFTGTGVKVAVLDTGIDATHPDLADRVVAQRNFTEDPDSRDVIGHGTHVASTVAGSGAASNGQFKGVATGAKLLDGKVCESLGCTESAILAGMEWGAQNAKVINMSLGGEDTPEVDPLEEAVNTLTAQHGTLFVIAAGNSGSGRSTVASPGSADAALTAGAVTKTDEMADFSSRGPRKGDSAIKPDITAPGVDITAARGKDGVFGNPGESYTELSGTSMATPHTAGAAAILAQQHPTWTPEQLKSALMASAKTITAASVFDQGAGRVDLTRAITAQIIANPASVSFGLAEWPHGDDAPINKTIGYHNFGSAPVTLNLAVNTTGPGGAPAPAGMFILSAPMLTVPAGGDASVTVSASTKAPGRNGVFSGYLTATAGAQVVRTPIAVDKEVESYDLTLSHKNRSGQATSDYFTALWNYGDFFLDAFDPDGTVTVRVPKGRYLVSTAMFGSDPDIPELTQLLRPVVNVTKDQHVTLDARKAKPVSVTVPRRAARSVYLDVGFMMVSGDFGFGSGVALFDSATGVYAAQFGSQRPIAGLVSTVTSIWADRRADGRFDDSKVVYTLFWYDRGRFYTGFRRNVVQHDLATVRESFAKHAEDSSGGRVTFGVPPARAFLVTAMLGFGLPFSRTSFHNVDKGVQWLPIFLENVPDPEFPFPLTVSEQDGPLVRYQVGKVYSEDWNRGVFGPAFPAPSYPDQWVSRRGDTIIAGVPLYSDRAGHAGFGAITDGKTTLWRNGKKLGETRDVYFHEFTVPAAKARYRLQTTASRGTPFSLSTRIDTTWTFRSGHVGGESFAVLPLSAVRFAPDLSSTNTAPAGQKFTLPVTVQRQTGAPAGTTKTLTVEVSYDDGAHWKTVTLVRSGQKWTAELSHPSTAGFVSLRAKATDSGGNTVEQTIIRAYRISADG